MTEAMVKSEKVINAYTNSLADATLVAHTFGKTMGQDLTQALGLSESAFASNIRRLREIPDEISIIQQKISALQDTGTRGTVLSAFGLVGNIINKGLSVADAQQITNLQHQIGVLNNQQVRLTLEQETIAKSAPWAKASAEVVVLNEKLQETRQALLDIQTIGAESIALGVSQPIEAANANLAASKKVLDEILQDNQRIQNLAFSGAVPTDRIEEFLAKQHSQSDIGAAAARVKADEEQKRRIEAVNDLATTFSTAVGDGLRDAILNAKKPMEALAAVGQNLFANMVDQTIKRLETGLTDAFKAISGAAGEGVGLAITGILGVAGAVLSKLGSKGSDSFGSVQSSVTSTQAVRGIVAGPSSVAIATVADDLSRAIAPVVARLDGILGALGKIESNTRSGRSGGLSSNVAIASA
jgi:hypothetical protein